MLYIPCNSALLAQETLFLTQKGTFFAQRSPKSAQIATNLNSRQNSVCLGRGGWGFSLAPKSDYVISAQPLIRLIYAKC